MQVRFDEETLDQSRTGSITGVVHFVFDGGSAFPGARWNDFPVVLASWWLEALDRLQHGRSGVMRFMDGPYSVAVAAAGTQAQLRCMEHRRSDILVLEVEVPLPTLRAELHRFAGRVAAACAKRKLTSRDLDALVRRLPH